MDEPWTPEELATSVAEDDLALCESNFKTLGPTIGLRLIAEIRRLRKAEPTPAAGGCGLSKRFVERPPGDRGVAYGGYIRASEPQPVSEPTRACPWCGRTEGHKSGCYELLLSETKAKLHAAEERLKELDRDCKWLVGERLRLERQALGLEERARRAEQERDALKDDLAGIGHAYNNRIEELLDMQEADKAEVERLQGELAGLRAILREFWEHWDISKEGAEKGKG